MIKFNREEGLTLIELLITIAVIAIVAAISVPVISNVVGSSNDNSKEAMQSQVDAFEKKYKESGAIAVSADGLTVTGYVDLNGDGDYVAADDELIETLVLDAKFGPSGTQVLDTAPTAFNDGDITGPVTGS
jgi:prepilin-type N-terminal cleavage/methylation domain-containing protein